MTIPIDTSNPAIKSIDSSLSFIDAKAINILNMPSKITNKPATMAIVIFMEEELDKSEIDPNTTPKTPAQINKKAST